MSKKKPSIVRKPTARAGRGEFVQENAGSGGRRDNERRQQLYIDSELRFEVAKFATENRRRISDVAEEGFRLVLEKHKWKF